MSSKISALPASTTPLAGTEVLPIVQSSATRQVSVANLTAGRAISATQLTLTTGNLIVASGQGIDFSATAGTGTSELFNDYEEGTWTPIRINFTEVLGGGTITSTGKYTKVGNLVQIHCDIICAGGASIAGTGNVSYFTGQPFTSSLGASGSYSQFFSSVFGGMLINTGTLFVVNTTFGATSSQIVFDCTYRI